VKLDVRKSNAEGETRDVAGGEMMSRHDVSELGP
jgi:hypothetical protein